MDLKTESKEHANHFIEPVVTTGGLEGADVWGDEDDVSTFLREMGANLKERKGNSCRIMNLTNNCVADV